MAWRTMRRLVTARDGNVAMILAGGLTMLTGTAVLGVDTATLYLEKRRLQGTADAAALAAAADLTNASARAQAAVALSSDNNTRLTVMTPGRFTRDERLTVDARFLANGTPGNAARVALESRIQPVFARIFGYRDVMIGARATAARIDMAGFSIGTRLASVQGGLPGALLSQLAGSELSLSVMDYNALVSGQVDLLKTAELLRTGGGVRVSNFDDLLATLKLTKAEMAEVRQPLLRAIAYRIYARFLSVMQSFPILPDDERGKNIVPKDIGTLMNSMQFSVLNIDTEDDMKKLFAAFLPDGLLPDQRKAAGKYVDQLVALYKECKKAGGPTPDFLAFETRSFTNVGTGETARAIYDGVPIPEPEPTR